MVIANRLPNVNTTINPTCSPPGDRFGEWDDERDGWVDPFFALTEAEQDRRAQAVIDEVREAFRHAAESRPAEGDAGKELEELYGRFKSKVLNAEAYRPGFPLHVLPSPVRHYIEQSARSIHCSPDLIAVTMLAAAGAAVGRSGRELRVKDGWEVTGCLWTICVQESSGGKTPAIEAAMAFYKRKQSELYKEWEEKWQAHKENPKENDDPGRSPALVLTDTTIEGLQCDLAGGAVLYARDELGALCHQMGRYTKGSGGSERYDWCSFWSHSSVNIGRKGSDRVYVERPFVGLTGTMVPSSARELNFRGNKDDGFVHRMLISNPPTMPPRVTLEGVPDALKEKYTGLMLKLFDEPKAGRAVLRFEPRALRLVMGWANNDLYARLSTSYVPKIPLRRVTEETYGDCEVVTEEAPGWVVSKYRKLFENVLRLSLVLHEIWRVAGSEHVPEHWEPGPRDYYGEDLGKFHPDEVDRLTVERAIAVGEYFRDHVPMVQSLLGESTDEVDAIAARLSASKVLTVRQAIHKTSYKSASQVLDLFAEMERRGFGVVRAGKRKDTKEFAFS